MKKAVRFLKRLARPLMNQRGLAGEAQPDPNAFDVDENGFIAGTNYKSVQDLIRGHGELKNRFDAQGNELGQVRGRAQSLAEAMREMTQNGGRQEDQTRTAMEAQADAPESRSGRVSEYGAMACDIQAKLESLDPRDSQFAASQANLIRELTKYTALAQHEKTLAAAGSAFQQELSEREAAKAREQFLAENPGFAEPEMQRRIGDFLANDSAGLHDEISAFFKMQAGDSVAELNSAAAENAEMRKILELQHGKDSTGRVMTGGLAPQPVPKTTSTGKDLNRGMADVLRKMRGEA